MSAEVRRGPKATMPSNATRGELLVTLDTGELFMALGTSLMKLNLNINDTGVSATDVWSSQKIKSYVDAAIAAIPSSGGTGTGTANGVVNKGSVGSLQAGLDSAKPATGADGDFYFAKNTNTIYYWDATAHAWQVFLSLGNSL